MTKNQYCVIQKIKGDLLQRIRILAEEILGRFMKCIFSHLKLTLRMHAMNVQYNKEPQRTVNNGTVWIIGTTTAMGNPPTSQTSVPRLLMDLTMRTIKDPARIVKVVFVIQTVGEGGGWELMIHYICRVKQFNFISILMQKAVS